MAVRETVKKIFSKSSVLVIILMMMCYVFLWNKASLWKSQRIFRSDVVGYYNYLPGAFIYHDLSFMKKPVRWGFTTTQDGKRVEKMT